MSHNRMPTFSVQDEPPRHLDKANRSQPGADEGQFQDDRCRATISRPLAQIDVAVPFFLTHYASLGRDMQSARGYFEMLIPVYTTQAQNSALVLAISAVASEIFSLWRHQGDSFRSLRLPYARAVARVRLAVQDPIERRSPATVFAVLALQLYENIAAVFGLRSATSVHQNGAASLLALTDVCNMDLTLREHVRRFMFHTEVAAAMRQKRPLSSIAHSLIGSKNSDVIPENPTSMLDTIGSCVAELQATAVRLFSSADPRPLSIHVFAEVQAEARNLDHQLLSWSKSVPDNWQPQRLNSGQEFDPSMPSYDSICELYMSCPVADTWNLWRFQRLILLRIMLRLLVKMPCMMQEELDHCGLTARELVDGVCYSIPFYLGNRTNPISISDFIDPDVLLSGTYIPQSRPPWDDVAQNHEPRFQKQDYRHHIISQGPWQAMNPLSRLLSLLSDDYGHLLASCIRPGQYEWIYSQFVRVTRILHLPSDKRNDYKEVGGTWNWSPEKSTVEALQ